MMMLSELTEYYKTVPTSALAIQRERERERERERGVIPLFTKHVVPHSWLSPNTISHRIGETTSKAL